MQGSVQWILCTAIVCYFSGSSLGVGHFRVTLRHFRHSHCVSDTCRYHYRQHNSRLRSIGSRFRNAPSQGVNKYSRMLADETYGVQPSSLVLELAVFIDYALYSRFLKNYGERRADAELQSYVFALLRVAQTVYESPTLKPKLAFRLVGYVVFKQEPSMLSYKHHLGDMTLYLPLFCQYQKRLNHQLKKWDHATLLSGYDLYQDGEKQFTGYATTHTICTSLSCSLVEARNFKSAYTLAHELGHSFGLQHDGVGNDCEASCCVMSPIIAFGQQKWSSCSQAEYSSFLEHLDLRDQLICLQDAPLKGIIEFRDSVLPGQRYTIDDQCRSYFGSCFHYVLRDGETMESLCKQTWCSDGGRFMNASHAALEGTYCGSNKWCRSGSCVSAPYKLQSVHGQWSEWNALDSSFLGEEERRHCGETTCSRCRVKGQLRVRREQRICNNPSPNNGGINCFGSVHQATACEDEPCKGLSIKAYASLVCRHLKIKYPTHAQVKKFSGKGMQRSDQRKCVVWCYLKKSQLIYTLFDPFPDGTPCGDGLHCVSGKCSRVLCTQNRGRDCILIDGKQPHNATFYETVGESTVARDDSEDEREKLNSWYKWSEWSSCSRTCGVGLRKRRRRCSSPSKCKGKRKQYQICKTTCPNENQPPINGTKTSGESSEENWGTTQVTLLTNPNTQQGPLTTLRWTINPVRSSLLVNVRQKNVDQRNRYFTTDSQFTSQLYTSSKAAPAGTTPKTIIKPTANIPTPTRTANIPQSSEITTPYPYITPYPLTNQFESTVENLDDLKATVTSSPTTINHIKPKIILRNRRPHWLQRFHGQDNRRRYPPRTGFRVRTRLQPQPTAAVPATTQQPISLDPYIPSTTQHLSQVQSTSLITANKAHRVPPIDLIGEWSSWGSWSWCTRPCDGGFQTGTRRCHPQGHSCFGMHSMRRQCNTRPCFGS